MTTETVKVDGKNKSLLSMADLKKLPIGTVLGESHYGIERNSHIFLAVDGGSLYLIATRYNEIEDVYIDEKDGHFFKEGRTIKAAFCKRSDGFVGALFKNSDDGWKLKAGCNTLENVSLEKMKAEALEQWIDRHGTPWSEDDDDVNFKRNLREGRVDTIRVLLNRETRRLVNRMFAKVSPAKKAVKAAVKAPKKAAKRRTRR